MKKVFAGLLVLVFVMPARAVTISCMDTGGGKLRLTYDVPNGEVLRGVALKLSTVYGSATIAGTNAVTAVDSFFDVFPDYAFSNPSGFTVTPRVGHPLADPLAPGALATFPASEFSLCMAVLDETGSGGGATGSGVLCEIQYTLYTTASILIEADTLRGGAVVGDNVTQPALPMNCMYYPPPSKPTLVKTTPAPAIATRVNSGRVETFVASATSAQGCVLEYQFNWGDGNTGPWGSATQSHAYIYTAATTYNVTVRARCVVDGSLSEFSDPLVLTTEEFSSSIDSAAYAAWAYFGRKPCWSYNRNCRGDANGRKVGLYAVTSHDLNALKAAYTKQDSVLQTISYDPDGTGTLPAIPGICTDFNKTKIGLYRVTSTDLTVLKTYYTKMDSAVPVCPLGAGDGKGIIYYTTP